MAVRETEIEQYFAAQCSAAMAWCLKMACLSFAGFPDRMVLKNGRAWFVELKAPNRFASRRQELCHQLLHRFGFMVPLLDTKDKVDIWIKTSGVLE